MLSFLLATARDEIIQIACVIKNHTDSYDLGRILLTLKTCSNISGCVVKSFSDERKLLQEFQMIVLATDPDLITGYNITNFDLPYILNRAHALGLSEYFCPSVLTPASASSAAAFRRLRRSKTASSSPRLWACAMYPF